MADRRTKAELLAEVRELHHQVQMQEHQRRALEAKHKADLAAAVAREKRMTTGLALVESLVRSNEAVARLAAGMTDALGAF